MRIGSLFSGAGGLDVAVESVFGGEVVWQSEVDKAASAVLAHRWPNVLNLGDITAVDWDAVAPVDVLCGGFPCQDVSAAGKRAGLEAGTRSGLWSVFADAIDHLRPDWVVIENVRGLLSARAHRNLESADGVVGDGSDGPVLRAAGAVLGDLANLRYDAIWATVAASDIGAPHRRERVFILASNTASERQFIGEVSRATTSGKSLCSADQRGDEPGLIECIWCRRMIKPGTETSHPCVGEKAAMLPTPRATDGTDGPVTNCPSVQAICDGSAGRAPRLSEMAAGGMFADEPGVALLPTPTAQSAKHGADSRFGGGNGDVSNLWQIAHLLPTPASADGQRGQDFARASRDGSGGDDLVTLAVKADRDLAWGKYEPAIRRWEALTRPAPAPTEPNKNNNPRLSAAFSEWLMGWPTGWVTAIGISRNDQLRIIGNGVCPQQAVAALRFLLTVSEVAA